MAGCYGSFVRYAAVGYGGYNLPTAKRHQRPLGILTVRLIKFGGVYARETNVNLVNDNRVAINDPAVTLDNLLPELLLYLAKRLLRLGRLLPW